MRTLKEGTRLASYPGPSNCFTRLRSIMVRAWYMDKAPGDQRLEHRAQGTADVPLDRLASLGVLYWKVSS